jgi:hypothetical protein
MNKLSLEPSAQTIVGIIQRMIIAIPNINRNPEKSMKKELGRTDI